MFGKRAEATSGYDVPPSSNAVWLDGPNRGKPVKSTPIKLKPGQSFKLDPNEAELRQQASYLASLGNVGALEQRAAFAKWQMQEAEAQFEKAKLIQSNPALIAQHAPPPRRWPLIALVTLLAGLFGLQVWTFVQSQRRPTLQGGSEIASESLSEVPSRQARAEGKASR